MLLKIAAFEFRYQLRSPVFWVSCVLFFLLTFGSVAVDGVQIGGRGNVNFNSPYAILLTLGVMSFFAIFVVVAMVSNVVLRDEETGFAPILRSTPLRKHDYLLGRFSGATAAAFLVYATIPLGILVGSLMPWLDADKIGPFRATDYLYALFVWGLPTLLVSASVFFSISTATRSMMWTYVAAVAILVLYVLVQGLLSDPRFDTVTSLTDPFALATLETATKYWTASERNSLLPQVGGRLLANRVLWLTVSALLYAIAHATFRFAGRPSRAVAAPVAASEAAPAIPWAPTVRQAGGGAADGGWARRSQLAALTRLDVSFVVRSPAFFVLLAIGVLNAGASLWFAGNLLYGSPSLPVTRLMVTGLSGSFGIIPIIVAVYYSGELVWRDRERRMHEIVDATGSPDWVHLVPKIVAIILVLLAVNVVAVLAGIAVQLIKGYTHLELGSYLLWYLVPQTIGAVQIAILALFTQVLAPQKYLGWGLMVVYVVAQVAAVGAGFEHSLYNYSDTSPVPLSDMNGMGRFWIGRAWFQGYWSAVAVMLAVLSYLLWRRGTTTALSSRFAAARWRLRGGAALLLAGAGLTATGLGAFIFYNTNVLNAYRPAAEDDRLAADMERDLLRFESEPQPHITAVSLTVDLYPSEVRAVTRGSYEVVNRTAAAIPRLHLQWDRLLRLDTLALGGARLEKDYPRYHHAIYRLDSPLAPGERRVIGFTTTLEERGFPNSRPLTRIVANGTFLENSAISPGLGVSREGFLTDRSKRRKYGLPADLRPAKLEDDGARAANILRPDSDWVSADITVSTTADQVPVAPGYVVADRVANGRRTVRFRTEAPINHFFSIQSARYAIARDRFGEVELAVYHHPGHDRDVPRMIAAMKSSLALFSKEFSPYQFRQARILEFPGYEQFAQSFANTIPYSESIGFIQNHSDPQLIDLVTYVTAHEIAHQWWGHQLVPANQQGATMLVESFAQYSALLVMEQTYGRDQVRRFLKYELDRYLRARGGEVVEELPLARVENQPYVHYNKGTLAMFWLREVVGVDVVNRAMRRLLAEYAFHPAPYPNTRDFIRILRAEAGPAYDALITDLFEKITLLDLKAQDATSRRLSDGRYEVSFTVEGRKLYADGSGRETEAPLEESCDVGIFAAKPGDTDFSARSVLAFERRLIRSGKQTISVVVSRPPVWVGVDPYNKRIDRNSDDNLIKVGGP